ncbi:MAG: MotA/TolQ/ExbB proton channel family protein [Steroidobacteraceae bacterium]|nr:MotA/TolQ/ExbB proton channel family protein [Steroidobacteraceae bacterium]
MVRFFQEGGIFMWPIAIVFFLGLAIAFERYFYVTRQARLNRALWDEVTPHLQAGNFKAAVDVTQGSPSFVASILSYGLARIRNARSRDDVEKAMEESLMEVLPKLERRTPYLASFANIATLLGLLGTIIGLIQAFQAVAAANPAEKAELLSSSISVAMNTTAFGLMVAIPLLLIHSVIQSKTTQVVDSLEMVSVKFLNSIAERQAAPAQQPRG